MADQATDPAHPQIKTELDESAFHMQARANREDPSAEFAHDSSQDSSSSCSTCSSTDSDDSDDDEGTEGGGVGVDASASAKTIASQLMQNAKTEEDSPANGVVQTEQTDLSTFSGSLTEVPDIKPHVTREQLLASWARQHKKQHKKRTRDVAEKPDGGDADVEWSDGNDDDDDNFYGDRADTKIAAAQPKPDQQASGGQQQTGKVSPVFRSVNTEDDLAGPTVQSPSTVQRQAADSSPVSRSVNSVDVLAEPPKPAGEAVHEQVEAAPAADSSSDSSDTVSSSSDDVDDLALVLDGAEVKSGSEDEAPPGKAKGGARRRDPNEPRWPQGYIPEIEPVLDANDIEIREAGHIQFISLLQDEEDGWLVLIKAADQLAGAPKLAPGAEVKSNVPFTLDRASIICTEEKVVVAGIGEVIGRVGTPMYVLAFREKEKIDALGLKQGDAIFYFPKYAKSVFPAQLRDAGPATDASGVADEEFFHEDAFSDDEKERYYKSRGRKGYKGGIREKIKVELGEVHNGNAADQPFGKRMRRDWDAPPRHSALAAGPPAFGSVGLPEKPPMHVLKRTTAAYDYDHVLDPVEEFRGPPAPPSRGYGRGRSDRGRGDRGRGDRDRGDRDRGDRGRGDRGTGDRGRGNRGNDRDRGDRVWGNRDRRGGFSRFSSQMDPPASHDSPGGRGRGYDYGPSPPRDSRPSQSTIGSPGSPQPFIPYGASNGFAPPDVKWHPDLDTGYQRLQRPQLDYDHEPQVTPESAHQSYAQPPIAHPMAQVTVPNMPYTNAWSAMFGGQQQQVPQPSRSNAALSNTGFGMGMGVGGVGPGAGRGSGRYGGGDYSRDAEQARLLEYGAQYSARAAQALGPAYNSETQQRAARSATGYTQNGWTWDGTKYVPASWF